MKKFAVGFYVGGGEYMTYIRFKADTVEEVAFNKIKIDGQMEIEFGEAIGAIVEE